MAKVCYRKGHRVKATGKRYVLGEVRKGQAQTANPFPHRGRAGQAVLCSGELWGHVQNVCPGKPTRVPGSQGLLVGWSHRHVL